MAMALAAAADATTDPDSSDGERRARGGVPTPSSHGLPSRKSSAFGADQALVVEGHHHRDSRRLQTTQY